MAAFGFIPNTLDPKLPLLQRTVYAELHGKRLGCKWSRATQFLGPFGEHMEQPLLQAASLVALPVFVVLGAQIDHVLARYIGWPTGRGKHLALHHGLNLARNLHQELF